MWPISRTIGFIWSTWRLEDTVYLLHVSCRQPILSPCCRRPQKAHIICQANIKEIGWIWNFMGWTYCVTDVRNPLNHTWQTCLRGNHSGCQVWQDWPHSSHSSELNRMFIPGASEVKPGLSIVSAWVQSVNCVLQASGPSECCWIKAQRNILLNVVQ